MVSFLSLNAWNAQAQTVEICGRAAQGEILWGKTEDFTKIDALGKNYKVSADGDFIIALGRDEKAVQKIVFETEDGQKSQRILNVAPTKWDVQSLKGVQPRKVNPVKVDLTPIERERKLIREALAKDLDYPYWKSGFVQPVEGRISGNFGGQRIMNGYKKSPHAGTDIAVLEGTPVKAAGDGVVTLVGYDLFYSGNVLIVDHGHGLQTIYAHLSSFDVKEGQKVKKGDVVAKSGKTGRVTGPHLHWGASLNGVKFNPLSLLSLGAKDKKCFKL